MRRVLPSDLIFVDFVHFLAKLRLSQYIISGRGPSTLQIRKYCTRVGNGGYNIESARWHDMGKLEVK